MQVFQEMIGATIKHITGGKVGDLIMRFSAEDGRGFAFYPAEDCESGCDVRVRIEDIVGDLDALIGAPIVIAEEVDSGKASSDELLWTFYRFGTVKGVVTVRWLGESNGYYAMGVEYRVDPRIVPENISIDPSITWICAGCYGTRTAPASRALSTQLVNLTPKFGTHYAQATRLVTEFRNLLWCHVCNATTRIQSDQRLPIGMGF